MRSLALVPWCTQFLVFLCIVATLLRSTLFLNVFPVTVMSFLLWLYLSGSCTDRKGISKWIINKTNYVHHLFLKPESKWGFFFIGQACAPLYHWRTVKMSGEKDPVGTCYVAVQNFSAYAEYSPCRTSESLCSPVWKCFHQPVVPFIPSSLCFLPLLSG